MPAIVEILCAFIRTHAKLPARLVREPRSPPDVSAALKVLAGRPSDSVDAPTKLDTFGAYLAFPSGDLRSARLAGADLSQGYFRYADLSGSDLRDSDLNAAYLAGADLDDANLESAWIWSNNFEQAKSGARQFSGSSLHEVGFGSASLIGADSTNSSIDGVDFRFADLTDSNITSEQLSCVKINDKTKLPAGVHQSSPPSSAFTDWMGDSPFPIPPVWPPVGAKR
ncbi:pentapeptide repeat-containing protein [Actinoplanes sp. NPDC049548]|uniref:pentapeptide repeat-containing protein n=1 Tax=Actinoplanes sp. NPDC049548 TaxID=3155152 RepID=UPI00341A1EF2